MKKLIVLIAILMVSLAGCGFTVRDLNNSTNESTTADLQYSSVDEEVTTENNKEQTQKEDKAEVQKPDTSNLPTKVIKEGETIEFKNDLAYDPDGDKLTYQFSEPLDKNGKWETEMGDAGEYIITVTVTDGKLNSKQKIKLIVEAINKLPVISNFKDITVKEGDKIKLNPEVSDEDGDAISLTYSGFMTKETYQTTYDDAGKYQVTLTASDGKQSAKKTINVIVENTNRAPTIEGLSSITVTEGEKINVEPTVNDPDGDAISLTFEKPLNKDGKWETKEGDAGKYAVKVSVSDGELTTTKTIELLVKSLNNAPTIEIAKTITVDEGDLIKLNPKINDADGDSLKITYSGFMTTSTYQTTYDDAGEYETTISVSDGKETVKKTVSIIIKDKNRAPVFNEEWFE